MIDVSADWAHGSSGSAVLDDFGNAVGLVSEISAQSRTGTGARAGRGPFLVIHEAASAREVLKLVRPGR